MSLFRKFFSLVGAGAAGIGLILPAALFGLLIFFETTFPLMRSAYLSVLMVWSALEAAGDTFAIMTVLLFLFVKESLSTKVNLDER